MPWLIQHKCHADDAPSNYGIFRGNRNGQNLTRFRCLQCDEEFYVLGHEFFGDAHSAEEAGRRSMPPGFVVASRKPPEPGHLDS